MPAPLKPAYPFFVPVPPPYPYVAWPYPPQPQPWIAHSPAKGPHAVVSAGPNVVPYNVALYPREAIPHAYQAVGTHPMLSRSDSTRIRVISKAFPWVIEITAAKTVTCKDLWKALYSQLQQPIIDLDWAYMIRDETSRRAVTKAYEKRVKPEDRSKSPIRRIDYLGNSTFFIGLEKDDTYAQSMLMPGTKKAPETWIARFTKSP